MEFQEPEVRGPENNCGRIIYTCGKVTIKSVDNPFESDVLNKSSHGDQRFSGDTFHLVI